MKVSFENAINGDQIYVPMDYVPCLGATVDLSRYASGTGWARPWQVIDLLYIPWEEVNGVKGRITTVTVFVR